MSNFTIPIETDATSTTYLFPVNYEEKPIFEHGYVAGTEPVSSERLLVRFVVIPVALRHYWAFHPYLAGLAGLDVLLVIVDDAGVTVGYERTY